MNTYRTFIVVASLLTMGACGKSQPQTKPAAANATTKNAAAKPADKAAAKPAAKAAAKPAAKPAAAKANTKPKAAPVTGQIPAPSDVAAPPSDAVKTASGLASKVLTKGTETAHPGAADIVKVHYTGWTTDGKMFDSSVKRGEPIEFPLNRVIAGWTEGVQLMVVGEKRRLWIPQDLAYKGRPGAPAGMLVFDVELLAIKAAPKPPAVPKDVAAPPADAEKTKSNLASKVLKKGTGTTHPTSASMVSVHYSGWTTDGKMFDSSVMRGKPAQFPLSGVIAGWTEGVQLMVEGETRRFWIPEKLAYQGRPGAPAGMLVFDVELLKIMK
ncbi:MAG: FKBP-type peptidyl-prolyl cis-trans isomerase [Myxococcales bacterium]|nr:FKBP-type peptidyl-prolyl cis-trans isomerase [Myxococcales bacterium]